jgi:mannosyltransferase
MSIEPGPFLRDRDALCSRAVKTEPCESAAVATETRGVPALHVWLWMALAIALATALRLFRLGTKSFWLDEAISAVLAQACRHAFVTAIVHRQANMVLYYLFLRGWILLGSSEFVVRLLSVVAGVAAIPAIYLLGARLFGPRTGRIAALLLSVHAFHIRYSQEARAYSLVMFLAILSSLFFLLSLERPSRKNWGLYVCASTLMVYAQVFGGWVLLAQWASLLLLRREIRWKQFLGSVVMICLLISPLAYCLLFLSDRSQLYWAMKPTLQDLHKFCLNMTGDGGSLLLLAYLGTLVGGIAVGLRRARHRSSIADIWKSWFLLFWLILPIVLVLAVSLRWPVFESRFLIGCVPPLVLLVANGVTQIRSRVLFCTALTILLALSLSGTYSYYRARGDAEHTDDWRDATRYILSQAETGDAVLFSYSEERLAFDEYRRRLQIAGSPIHEFPEETELELLTLRPSRPSPELLDSLAAGYRRVWVISAFQPNSASRKVDAVLRSRFREHGDRSFGCVHADLFANPMLRLPDQQGDKPLTMQ